ncbi:MAG: anaerobic sulfatase maturase, partial [Planctomycetes bacterium]|nr:anaerobic sulfatase maturase [Planctomycetota bacterium]
MNQADKDSEQAAPDTRPVRPFNIMCKPVCGLCNLNCSYCYYVMKPRELYPGRHRFKMTDEILDTYTRQYIEAMPVHVDFGWQGGEPTLAGLDFFRKAVAYQRRYARPGQEVANALQTNGTLLNDEWCEFLAANHFLVGISLDGPAQWHDAFRRDRLGRKTFHRAWHGLELLRKHSVEFNVLVTLNSVNAPHAGDIYRFFVNRGIRYLQFIPILERDAEGNILPFSCKPDQWGRFLLDVFEQWASRDVGAVSERFIDNLLHTIIFGKASMCCYSERCANAHILEWNGDLYACDHFVFKEWKIGNIMDRPLVDLLADPLLEKFAALKTAVPDACRDCEFFEFCRAGCPKHHVPIGTDPARVNWFCEGYKLFFREALPELRRMAEYIRRGQLPPLKNAPPAGAPTRQAARRRESFQAGPPPDAPIPGRADVLPPAKPPGRNDPCPC